MNRSDVVHAITRGHSTLQMEQANAYAPANIALCKYWGKRNAELNLPLTGSLSVSLHRLGTSFQVAAAEKDSLEINGVAQESGSPLVTRLFGFIRMLCPASPGLHIQSTSTLPIGAGLASSASAFAAIVRVLDQLFGWQCSPVELSILARLGSGSACRSVFDGFVEWLPGQQDDGMDSHAKSLEAHWPDFRIGLCTLSAGHKPVGSREGMNRTVRESKLFQSWPTQVAADLPRIRQGILDQDLELLGSVSETNALAMHATMFACTPPLVYWLPESVALLHRVWQLRKEGLSVYATMDAGPNVKLIYLKNSSESLKDAFPQLEEINPFAPPEPT